MPFSFGAAWCLISKVMKSSRNETWIYGIHSVRATLMARPDKVKELVVTAGHKGPRPELVKKALGCGIEVRELASREVAALTGSDSHQGVAIRAPLPDYGDLADALERPPRVLVVLDGVTDPHNLGAIVRSAEALGVSAVVLPKDRSAGITPTVHKASAGALEFLPVCRVTNLARSLREIKESGYWIYGAEAAGDLVLESAVFDDKTALVIGAEGRGIRPGVKNQVDFTIRIALSGKTKSLNASVASAVILREMVSQRSSLSGPDPPKKI